MPAMDRTRLEKVLGRYKKSELPGVASELGVELSLKATKKELVSLLVQKCLKNEITPSKLLTLELSSNYCLLLWGN